MDRVSTPLPLQGKTQENSVELQEAVLAATEESNRDGAKVVVAVMVD